MRIPRTQSLGSLAFLGIGCWCFVQILTSAPFVFLALADDSNIREWLWPQVAQLSLYLVAGTGLILFRSSLAATLVARDTDFELDELTLDRAEQTMVALLGIWIAANALASGIAVEAGTVMNFEQHRELFERGGARGRALMSDEAWQSRLTYLPHFVIGVCMVFGAENLQKLMSRSRKRGANSQPIAAQQSDESDVE